MDYCSAHVCIEEKHLVDPVTCKDSEVFSGDESLVCAQQELENDDPDLIFRCPFCKRDLDFYRKWYECSSCYELEICVRCYNYYQGLMKDAVDFIGAIHSCGSENMTLVDYPPDSDPD